MEDQENRLVLLGTDGILDVFLVLAQQFRVKLDVAWLINTMNISEAGGYGEVWRDRRQGFVNVEDVLRLCIKRVVVDILIVYTILLTASDTNFLECNMS